MVSAKPLLLLLLILLAACENNTTVPKADTIFIGTILTADLNDTVAKALAIQSDKIIAVGEEQDVMQFATSDTNIIKLGQSVLMPGFVAAHEHPVLSAVFDDLVDLSGFTHSTNEQLWASLQAAIDNTPEGEWIYAMGIDPVLVDDLQMPTRVRLDQIAPHHPIILISQSMHSFWVNSLAYQEVGIDDSIQDPVGGGHYGKDHNGRLNGFIAEGNAAAPFLAPLRSPLRVAAKLKLALKELNKQGFTSVASLGFNVPPWLAEFSGQDWFQPFIRQVIYLKEDELSYLPDSVDNGDSFFKVAGIKLWHDGSPYAGTMFLFEPYSHSTLTEELGIQKGTSGQPLENQITFQQKIKQFHAKGWQLAIHSQGDASTQQVVDILANLQSDNPRRHRLEHCLLLPTSTLQKMQKADITPSFHINHIWYYGDALQQHLLGEERSEKMLPVRSAFAANLHPTLHADSPMFPASAFSLMNTAVRRQTIHGKSLGMNESISPQQALKAMTINGAWQLHQEEELGSLEVNKLADLILVSGNIYTEPNHNWSNISVERVWVGGREIELE